MSEYKCQYTYDSGNTKDWIGRWEIIDFTDEVTELRVSGRGSSYDIVLGNCNAGNFMCIPGSDKGCALGHWSDVFWNTERIARILNVTDTVTIATGLADFCSS